MSEAQAEKRRPTIVVVSGEIGSGKTSLCRRIFASASKRGLDCAGVLSPGRWVDGRKVGIDVLDVRSGERRPLAEADDRPGPIRTGAYNFDPAALSWGVEILNAATPCDLLLVDELGPLELVRGEGWANVLPILRDGHYQLGVVVVRSALLAAFRAAMPAARLNLVNLPNEAQNSILPP